jgi:hypothetical protein
MALNQLVIDIENSRFGLTPLLDAGVRMVIVKADEMFHTNSKILASAGMPIAAYHYISPSKDALEQANTVIEEIEKPTALVTSHLSGFRRAIQGRGGRF